MTKHHLSLKSYNTFGVDVTASQFYAIQTEACLHQCIDEIRQTSTELAPFILGGGSNVLFTQDIVNPVLHIELMGIQVISENDQQIMVEVGAGVNWHDFVLWSLKQDYYGLENLSLIPGSVGAAPVQNIGAYGVELSDCFDSLDAVCLKTGEKQRFSNRDCQFAYRHSIFKTDYQHRYVITKVRFRLAKHFRPDLQYAILKNYLHERNITHPTAQDVSQAVIKIRQSRLPDPNKIGNAGSFFKNPIIEIEQFQTLRIQYPDIVFFPVDASHVKMPAGWLIEQCGFKGKQIGNVGTYDKQALVIVNHGHASGEAVYNFAMTIQQTVKDHFGILLTPEVNIL